MGVVESSLPDVLGSKPVDQKGRSVHLSAAALGRAMPMHMCVDAAGRVTQLGPTLERVCGDLRGHPILNIMKVLRPKPSEEEVTLADLSGARLYVELKTKDGHQMEQLRALVEPLQPEGWLLNFSFAQHVLDGVKRHALSVNDFSPCDPTVEMLFVIEANAAVQRESARLNARLEDARTRAEALAATDKLTGLRNRRAMDAILSRMTEELGTQGFGLMNLDLDYFKLVNDTYGHAAGDHVLKHVAKVMREQVRRGDIVSRIGGDEFVLIFPDCVLIPTLDRIAQRIIKRIEQPIPFEGEVHRISASVGTTVSSFYDNPEAERMLADADHALYASKRAGRAQNTIFKPAQ